LSRIAAIAHRFKGRIDLAKGGLSHGDVSAPLGDGLFELDGAGFAHPDGLQGTAQIGRTEEAKALRERYGITEPEKPKSS
jgi:hypothetical protein